MKQNKLPSFIDRNVIVYVTIGVKRMLKEI
jgi:hypothetical protein